MLLIVDPRLSEEEVAQRAVQLQESLGALGGEALSAENWGRRRLTFEIGKQREGTYLLFQLKGEPAIIREYERQLRLNDSVLRFMTMRAVARRLKPAEAPPAESAATPEPTGVPPAESAATPEPTAEPPVVPTVEGAG